MKKKNKSITLLTIAIFIYFAGLLHISGYVEATWLGVLTIIGIVEAGVLALLLNEV